MAINNEDALVGGLTAGTGMVWSGHVGRKVNKTLQPLQAVNKDLQTAITESDQAIKELDSFKQRHGKYFGGRLDRLSEVWKGRHIQNVDRLTTNISRIEHLQAKKLPPRLLIAGGTLYALKGLLGNGKKEYRLNINTNTGSGR